MPQDSQWRKRCFISLMFYLGSSALYILEVLNTYVAVGAKDAKGAKEAIGQKVQKVLYRWQRGSRCS